MANKREVFVLDDNREEALERAIEQIEKFYGKGAIMKMGQRPHETIDHIPTGSISLDMATGIGGVPKGRIVEIYGPESSGKTTLTLHIVAEAQKAGGRAAFIDAEHALDPVYAGNLGVNVDELYVAQPDTGEQALEIAELLTKSGALDVIVIDSVAALVPKAEIQGDLGDSHVGTQARMMSQALRRLTSVISKSNTCVIFINQLREKIGVMFGNPETTTGGRALKFYSSMRIDVRKGALIQDGDQAIGARTKVKIAKNKLAPPFAQAEFDIMYGQGISLEGDVLDIAADCGLVKKSGAWYSYNEVKIGQGRENAKTYLIENPDVYDELYKKLFEMKENDELDTGKKKGKKKKTPAVAKNTDDELAAMEESKNIVLDALESMVEVDEDGVILE